MTCPRPGLVASIYASFIVLVGITYVSLSLTPSSYGVVLNQIGAPEEGPVFGLPRNIRSDEWADATAFFQVCVRNGFRRINETSLYREDLRNFYLLPLKDWSLVFKPEIWAFFVISPATAYSLYYVLLMWAFLIGYYLLFRQMEIDPLVAAAVTTLIYFSGFVQFWWTTFGSLVAGLPWLLIILLADWRWWWKAALFAWVMPVVCFSFVYPTFFAEFTFAAMVLVAATWPSRFRTAGEIAAVAIGFVVTGVLLYVYFSDLLPVMSHTWYPGKRVGSPGTTSIPVVLSQLYPFLAFSPLDYRHLIGANICEIGTVGSFLPLLTLCLVKPRQLWTNRRLRNSLMVILAAVALIMTWQMTPAPRWIGHLLLWDHGNAERLLFISGLLLTVASLLVWKENLLVPSRLRIAIFIIAGPVASLVLKMVVFHHRMTDRSFDVGLAIVGVVVPLIACLAPAATRMPILLATMVLLNFTAFGRFNPLQPAEPIFQVPETEALRQLRQVEASAPGRLLMLPGFFGATLNGMGIRSVSHTLMAPRLAFFRKYFPAMDAVRFDFVFNRYAHVNLTDSPLPQATDLFVISLPREAFEPVRNARSVKVEVSTGKDCSVRRSGAIEHVTARRNQLTIEGWAPWKGEEPGQQLDVTSPRELRADSLMTVKRPDVSEKLADYAYTRSGFRLQLSSLDGRPIGPDDIVAVASGTSVGEAQLNGCGCSSAEVPGFATKVSRP